jgi:hypothetical protein
MPTNAEVVDILLTELQDISFRMGDLNAIRNGEYEPHGEPTRPSRAPG